MGQQERDRFFRIEQAVVTALVALFTVFALIRADWIFDTYRADDRACSVFEHDAATGQPTCSINALSDALRDHGNVPLAYFSDPTNVLACRDPSSTVHAYCQPVPKALAGRLRDPMLASGYGTVLFGLWVSLWLGPLFRRMSEQLRRDAIIDWSAADEAGIDTWRVRLSYGVAGLVGVCVAAGFVVSHFKGLPDNRPEWEFLLSATILGALAGHRLGVAAALGRVGRLAMQRGQSVQLILGHADKMGGAKRLGEFMAFQGVLISIPIAWLSIWLILELSGHPAFAHIAHWWKLHATLLGIAATISIFSFLRPLWSFSRHYQRARDRSARVWNEKTRSDLLHLQNTYRFDDWESMHAAIEQSAKITAVSEDLAALPSVPLRRSVQGVFSISTLFPLAAFVFEWILPGNSGQLAILNVLMNAFAGLLS